MAKKISQMTPEERLAYWNKQHDSNDTSWRTAKSVSQMTSAGRLAYYNNQKQKQLAGLDTFETDLGKLSDELVGLDGWRDQDTMAGYGKSVADMLERANAYKSYYSGRDAGFDSTGIDGVIKWLNDANDIVSRNSEAYGAYDSADAYNAAVKKYADEWKAFGSLSSEQLKKKRDDYIIERDTKNAEIDRQIEEYERLIAELNQKINTTTAKRKSPKLYKEQEYVRSLKEEIAGYKAKIEELKEGRYASTDAALEHYYYQALMKELGAEGYTSDKKGKFTHVLDPEGMFDYAVRSTDKELEDFNAILGINGGEYDFQGLGIYELTDAEKSLYLAIGDKLGKEAADQYFNYLYGTSSDYNMALAARAGKAASDRKSDIERLLGSFGVGVNTWVAGIERGINSLFSDEGIPTYAFEYESQFDRSALNDRKVMGALYDIGVSFGNMAPSILATRLVGNLLGAAGAVDKIGKAGIKIAQTATNAATFGTSIYGNAYNEALLNGHSKAQAMNYGALTAASEIALGELIGGIPGVGQHLSGKLIANLANKTSNVLLRLSAHLAGDAIGEFTEEYLQEVLGNVFRNLCLGENNEIKLVSEEALYSGIIGALTSAGLNIPTSIATYAGLSSTGKVYNSDLTKVGGVQALIEEGLAADPKSEAHNYAALLQKEIDQGKTPTNAKVGMLASILNEAVEDGEIDAAKGLEMSSEERAGLIKDAFHSYKYANDAKYRNEVEASREYTETSLEARMETAKKILSLYEESGQLTPELEQKVMSYALVGEEARGDAESVSVSEREGNATNAPQGANLAAVAGETAGASPRPTEGADAEDTHNYDGDILAVSRASEVLGKNSMMATAYLEENKGKGDRERQSANAYIDAYRTVYDYATSGVSEESVKSIVYGKGSNSGAALTEAQFREAYKEGRRVYETSHGIKNAASGEAASGGKIVANMSETERAAILRKASIRPAEIQIAKGFDIDFEQLERNRKSVVEKPLVEKLQKLGFLKKYKTDNVDVEFEFTGRGLRKSMHSQVADYGGNLGDLAKVVMNMQALLDRSVLIEVHTDKAKGTDRENARLVQTYVLLSAFQEKGTVTPVQFEIKQYVDNANRLYLAVALTKIETGVVGDTALQGEERTRLLPVSKETSVMGDTMLKDQASTRLLPVSNISIPNLVAKINPKDENFFKYIPDSLLNEEQIAAKQRALAREAKKYGREYIPSETGKVGSVKYSGGRVTVKGVEYVLPPAKNLGKLNAEQKAAVDFAEKVLANFGVDVVFFSSKTNRNLPNGIYDGKRIYIDIEAGVSERSSETLVAYAMAHELTHMAERLSPELWQRFADRVLQILADEKGVSVEGLIKMQQQADADARFGQLRAMYPSLSEKQLRAKIETIDPAGAIREIVADAAQTVFTTKSNLVEKLAEKDKGLAGQFWELMKRIFRKLQSILRSIPDDGVSGHLQSHLDELAAYYDEMAADTLMKAREGVVAENGGDAQMQAKRDYPIDTAVQSVVDNAFSKSGSQMHELGIISADQNKIINRLSNQQGNDLYRGKFTGGKHLFSDNAIRHIISEHGDFLREGLRAQLPMTREDIARHLSAVKANKIPTTTMASKTKEGRASILTAYAINGHTLYAEEIRKPLSKNLPSDLIGHTMYKAPTLPTAAFNATSAQTQPKRQSTVLCNYYIPSSGTLSTGNVIKDEKNAPALLSFVTAKGQAKDSSSLGGLIALSADANNFTDRRGTVEQGYVVCQKPFYITSDHRVFSNSDTDVAEKINELKKKGYDCFIFEQSEGDNYMVAVVNKAQIIKKKPTVITDGNTSANNSNNGQTQTRRVYATTQDRQILAQEVENIVRSDRDYEIAKKYKENLASYREMQSEIASLSAEIDGIFAMERDAWSEQDKERLDEAMNRRRVLREELRKADASLLTMEALAPLQSLVKQANARASRAEHAAERRVERAEQRADRRVEQQKERANQRYKDMLAHQRNMREKSLELQKERIAEKQAERRLKAQERVERSQLLARAERVISRLYRKITKPTKNDNIPSELMPLIKQLFEYVDVSHHFATIAKLEAEKDAINARIAELEESKADPSVIDAQKERAKKLVDRIMKLENASQDLKVNKTWAERGGILQEIMAKVEANNDVSGIYTTFAPGLAERMQRQLDTFTDRGTRTRLFDMDLDTLRFMVEAIESIGYSITEAHKLHAGARAESIATLGENTIAEFQREKKEAAKSKLLAGGREFFAIDSLTPHYFAHRLGGGTERVFSALSEGFNDTINKIRVIAAFRDKIYDKYKIETWTGKNERLHSVGLEQGGNITLTTTQIMTLYALSDRPQAQRHIYGQGVQSFRGDLNEVIEKATPLGERMVDEAKRLVGKSENALSANAKLLLGGLDIHKMTKKDVESLIDQLTSDQRACVKDIKKFLHDTVTPWGNAVTQELYLYNMFEDPHYFPIETVKTLLPVNEKEEKAKDAGQMSIFSILNKGFTKQVDEKAANPIVIRNIFEVFMNHAFDMANYGGMGVAVSDTIKWLNYKRPIEQKENSQTGGNLKSYGAGQYTEARLRENAKAVLNSKVVATLTGNEFRGGEGEMLSNRVVAFFDSVGNKAIHKELGEIALTKSSFRDDKAHGLTRNKVVSFMAVPQVIENGHVIDVYQPEGKPYERITIAAPITIGEEKFYVAVMVQRDHQSQRMYLHDIIAEEATLSFNTEPTTQKGEGIRDKGHLFITSILQNALSVKSDAEISKNSNGTEAVSVRSAMEEAYGEAAYRYIKNFLMSIEGTLKGTDGAKLLNKLTRNVKIASVGANLRVVALQGTAYVRAGAVLSGKNLVRALDPRKSYKDEAIEKNALMYYKSLGFYDMNNSRSLLEKLKGGGTKADKLREWSTFLAGKADEATWGNIWLACRYEVDDYIREKKLGDKIKRGSAEYFKLVNEKFDEVINFTQVIDSPFHKNKLMSDPDSGMKQVTAFMAEPMLTYNMIQSAASDWIRQKPGGRQKFRRAAVVWLVQFAAVVAVESIVDAARDRDDDEDLLEKYLQAVARNAFGINLGGKTTVGSVLGAEWSILNNLPIVKEIFSVLEGYDPSRMDITGIANLASSIEKAMRYVTGQSKASADSVIYSLTQAVSQVCGIPFSNLYRTIRSLINSIRATFGLNTK